MSPVCRCLLLCALTLAALSGAGCGSRDAIAPALRSDVLRMAAADPHLDLDRMWGPSATPTDPAPDPTPDLLSPGLAESGGPDGRDRYELGIAALADGDPELALVHLYALLDRDPDHSGARMAVGLCYLRQGRLQLAEQTLEEVVAQADANGLAWYYLGVARWRQGRNEGAIDSLSRAVTLRPDDARAHSALATALVEVGAWATAIVACEQALRIDPHYVEALHTLAYACARTGLWDRALTATRTAARLRPDEPETLMSLAEACVMNGLYDEALQAYEQICHLDPYHLQAVFRLGEVRRARGDEAGARECYVLAAEMTPRDGEEWMARSRALATLGRYEEAVASFGRVLEEDPDHPDALFELGAAHYQLEDWSQAAQALRRAIALRPDAPMSHYLLALTYVRSNEPQKARDHLLLLEMLDPAMAQRLEEQL